MWISRDRRRDATYVLWAEKPIYVVPDGFTQGDFLGALYPRLAHEYTNLKLKPGQCYELQGKIVFKLKKIKRKVK